MILQGLFILFLVHIAAAITKEECVTAGLTLCEVAQHCKRSCEDRIEPPKCPKNYSLCDADLQCKLLKDFQCGVTVCRSQMFCPTEKICKSLATWTEACVGSITPPQAVIPTTSPGLSLTTKPCLDNCKCAHAVEGLQACLNLDRHCQTMLRDPKTFFATFAQVKPSVNACPEGQVFCPKQGICISNTSTCQDKEDANHRTLIQSCLPCAADQRFFPALQRCIPLSDFENFQSRFQRFLGGLKEAFDDQCRVGEKFCLLNFTCLPRDRVCDLPLEISNNACPNNQLKYCPHRGLCILYSEQCTVPSFSGVLPMNNSIQTGSFIAACQSQSTTCAIAVRTATECSTQKLYPQAACNPGVFPTISPQGTDIPATTARSAITIPPRGTDIPATTARSAITIPPRGTDIPATTERSAQTILPRGTDIPATTARSAITIPPRGTDIPATTARSAITFPPPRSIESKVTSPIEVDKEGPEGPATFPSRFSTLLPVSPSSSPSPKYVLLNPQMRLREQLGTAKITLTKSLFPEGEWLQGEKEADTLIEDFPVELSADSYLRFQGSVNDSFGAAAVMGELDFGGRRLPIVLVMVNVPDPFWLYLVAQEIPPTIILENSLDGNQIRVGDVVRLADKAPVLDLPPELVPYLPTSLLETYKLRKSQVDLVETTVVLTTHNATWREGTFFLNEDGSGRDWKPILSISSAAPIPVALKSLIKFQPAKTFSGNVFFNLTLQIVWTPFKRMLLSPKSVRHTFIARNVNSRPIMNSKFVYLSPVPYDLDADEGFSIRDLVNGDPNQFRSGISVKEFDGISASKLSLATLASDTDTTDVGIAVYAASNSTLIGQWKYLTPNQKEWLFVPRKFENSNMLLLSPEARLKYVLTSPTRHWTSRDAILYTGIQFFAWDGSDNKTEGVAPVNVASGAYSEISSTGFILRLGCDGVIGSGKVFDQCKECGGLGKRCQKCDGTTDSDAVIDNCQNCVLGRTGRKFDDRKDAFGRCCPVALDTCQVCQAPNTRPISLADCNGVCNGKAFKNRCGFCVAGTTGKELDYGVDNCGLCKQNPLSASLNSICTVIINSLKPTAFSSSQPVELQVSGTGVFTLEGTKCRLFNLRSSADMTLVENSDVNNATKLFTLTLRAEAVAEGQYRLGCKFADIRTETVKEDVLITVLKATPVLVSKVYPSTLLVDTPVNISVEGSGFTNESSTFCSFPNVGVRPAVVVNSSFLKCAELTFRQVQPQKLELVNRLFTIRPSADINVVCTAPVTVKAEVAKDWSRIFVTFNKPAGLESASMSCEKILDSRSLALCGDLSVCGMQGRTTMEVRCQSSLMAVNMTAIRSLCINKNQVQCIGQRTIQEDGACTPVSVLFPPMLIPPTATISGPEKSAGCADVVLRGDQSKAGVGANLKYLWTVEYAGASPSSEEETKKLAALREDFKKGQPIAVMKKQYFSNGVSYKIKLRVTNDLRMENEVQHVLLIDNSELKPQVVIFGDNPRVHKASRDLLIKPFVEVKFCGSAEPTRTHLSFFWSTEPQGITFSNSERNLFIEGGSLTPGIVYNMTLIVSLTSNPNVLASATVQVNVTASPLRVRINKGSKRLNIACSGSLNLEALTEDPDNVDKDEFLQWECIDTGSNAPCMDYSDPDATVPLQLPSDTEIVVSQGSLECNSIYEFTVTYIKGERKAQASVAIQTVDNSPKISCRPPSFVANRALDDSEDVLLSCTVKCRSPVSATWSTLITQDTSAFDLSQEKAVSGSLMENFTTPFQSDKSFGGVMKLKLKGEALNAKVSYVFQLTASNEFASSVADVEVTIPPKPIAGTLMIDPAEGNTATAFSLTALNFLGDGLTYTFGYFPTDIEDAFLKYVVLAKDQDANILTDIRSFPEGKVTVFVQAKNSYGKMVTSQRKLNVTARADLNETVLKAMVVDAAMTAEEQIQKGNGDGALRELDSVSRDVISTLESTCGSSSSGQTEKLEEFVSTSLRMVSNVLADDARQDLLGQSLSLLKTITAPVCPDTLQSPTRDGEFITLAQTLLSKLQPESAADQINPEQAVRRRRSIDGFISNGNAPSGYPSEADMLKSLEVFSNMIDPYRYDEAALTTKENFLNLLPGYLEALSYHSQSNQYGQLGVENLTSLYVEMMPSLNGTIVETYDVEMGVELGSVLQDRYQFWNCSSEGDDCKGAYLGVIVMIDDLLSNEEDKNFVLVTDVVGIYLVNPVTFDLLDETDLENTLQVQLQAWDINQTANVECYMWQEENATWVEDECITSVLNESSVTCNCSRTGFIAAFEYIAPEIEVITEEKKKEEQNNLFGFTTSVSPTTVLSETTSATSLNPVTTAESLSETTTEAPSSVKNATTSALNGASPTTATSAPIVIAIKSGEIAKPASIKFTENYQEVVGKYGEVVVKQKIQMSIASALKINPANVADLRIREGSIIVEFILLLSQANMTSSLDNLCNALKSNTLAVKFDDGQTLTSDPQLLVDGNDYAAPEEEQSDDKSKAAIIAISVILGIAMIAVIVLVILYCNQKSRKVSPSPSSSEAELERSPKKGKTPNKHHGGGEKHGAVDRGHHNPVFHVNDPC